MATPLCARIQGVAFLTSFQSFVSQSGSDPLNATYTLDGQSISLQNGRSEIPISPDSATKIRTFIAGKPAAGDLDGDGDADVAVFLVQDGGGSGTFYYAAVALNLDSRYQGTNAVLLGDRVALKDMTVHNGMVIVRYADRRPDEPMSSDPAVEKRLPLTVVEDTLRALKPLAGVRPKGNCRSDFILVESPAWGETIASPLTVRGKARGTWFFEGDFPIVLGMKGNVIARGFVTAKGEWMTEEFVPFEGTLAFKKPAGVDNAILVFKKDNPTGRPKFDDEMRLLVFLK